MSRTQNPKNESGHEQTTTRSEPYNRQRKPDNIYAQHRFKCYKLQVTIRDTDNDKRVSKQELADCFNRVVEGGPHHAKHKACNANNLTPTKHRRYNTKTQVLMGPQ